jgi:RHS repeat-associated protein
MTSSEYSYQWSYDIWGNRLAQDQVGGSSAGGENFPPSFNAKNQLYDPQTPTAYQYDAAGNMTAEPGKMYQWDAEGRLKSLNGGGGNNPEYLYDAEGRRIKKKVGSAETYYFYGFDGRVAVEKTRPGPLGTTTVEYLYFAGRMIAQYKSGGTQLAHADHLGSTRVMTPYPYSGSVTQSMDYLPFGELISPSPPAPSTSHLFTGHERDTETGLDYFGARYYASALGRFLSADWSVVPTPVPYADFSNPQSLNLYTYVGNNPLNRTDPDGHCCDWSFSSISNWVDSKVDTAVSFYREKLVASGNPTAAGAGTFVAGSIGDGVKGLSNLLRTGESVGSLPENASAGQVITAVAEEGGRVGGTILVVTAIGARANAPSGDTLRPGPNAEGSVPASGTRITTAERAQVNQLGDTSGCHSCGASTPGTRSGNWVGDHQPPTALADGRPQALYPQCLSCSNRQGGQTTAAQRAGQQYPPPQPPPVVPRRPEEKP